MKIKCVGVKQSKTKRFSMSKKFGIKLKTTVEKLAYNNAAKYHSDDAEKSFDYTKKQVDDFVKSSFLLPKDVNTNKTKIELFNELDKKFSNDLEAKMAMNYIITLPQELDKDVGFKVVEDYFKQHVERKQNFIDLSLHIKNEGTEKANPHVHVLEGRRNIDKDGNIGKALHHRDVKGLMALDNIDNIRKDLANLFNQELKNAAVYNVQYTHLSNEKLVEQALENDDVALAIEKDYQTNTDKKQKSDKASFLERKNTTHKLRRLTLKQRIENKKAEAAQFKQEKAEIETLKGKIQFLSDKKSNLAADYANRLNLDVNVQMEEMQQKLVELMQNTEKYQEQQKQIAKYTRFLTVNFYRAMLRNGKSFKTKKEIRDFLKEQKNLDEKDERFEKLAEISLDEEEKDFTAAMLAHKIFTNIDDYVNKAQYHLVKEQKEKDKELYNQILEKANPTLEELVFVEKMNSKTKFENNLFREMADKAISLKKSSTNKDEFKQNFEMAVSVFVDMQKESIKNNSELNPFQFEFSDIEAEVKKVELYNYITRNIDKIIENKEEHIKKAEFFNQLKIDRAKNAEVRQIEQESKAKNYMNKQINQAVEEVLEEYDEVARLIYKHSDNALNADFEQHKNKHNYYSYSY